MKLKRTMELLSAMGILVIERKMLMNLSKMLICKTNLVIVKVLTIKMRMPGPRQPSVSDQLLYGDVNK